MPNQSLDKAESEAGRILSELEAIRSKLICSRCHRKPLLIHVAGDNGARAGSLCQHPSPVGRRPGTYRCLGKLKRFTRKKRN